MSRKTGKTKAHSIRARVVVGVLALLALGITLNAGVTYQGKPKMDKDWKVEVLKIKWGPAGSSTSKDRVMGSVKVLKEFENENPPGCTLVVQFVDMTNGVLRTSSLDVKQTLPTNKGRLNENKKFTAFEFAFDFPRIEDAKRMRLIDVKYKGQSVNYNNFFNVSGTLMRSGMALTKPKVPPSPLP